MDTRWPICLKSFQVRCVWQRHKLEEFGQITSSRTLLSLSLKLFCLHGLTFTTIIYCGMSKGYENFYKILFKQVVVFVFNAIWRWIARVEEDRNVYDITTEHSKLKRPFERIKFI
jgi:hypothetical protein